MIMALWENLPASYSESYSTKTNISLSRLVYGLTNLTPNRDKVRCSSGLICLVKCSLVVLLCSICAYVCVLGLYYGTQRTLSPERRNAISLPKTAGPVY